MTEQHKIPIEYLDGCTLFPDKFGKVSHRHICTEHDIDYWVDRTALGKVAADWKWLINLNKAHKENKLHWRIIVFTVSIPAYITLSTVGWYFWKQRDKFDR